MDRKRQQGLDRVYGIDDIVSTEQGESMYPPNKYSILTSRSKGGTVCPLWGYQSGRAQHGAYTCHGVGQAWHPCQQCIPRLCKNRNDDLHGRVAGLGPEDEVLWGYATVGKAAGTWRGICVSTLRCRIVHDRYRYSGGRNRGSLVAAGCLCIRTLVKADGYLILLVACTI